MLGQCWSGIISVVSFLEQNKFRTNVNSWVHVIEKPSVKSLKACVNDSVPNCFVLKTDFNTFVAGTVYIFRSI